ncbi:MAG: signal peptidase I [Pseudomonadota bacterium]
MTRGSLFHALRVGFLALALLLIVTLIVLRVLFLNPVAMEDASMVPTYAPGSGPFVSRWVGTPEAGDVVLFQSPASGQRVLRRIIAGPGETIQIVDGLIFVDGAAFRQGAPTGAFDSRRQAPSHSCAWVGSEEMPAFCHATWIGEGSPNGARYWTSRFDTAPLPHVSRTTLAIGEYFVLSDARDLVGEIAMTGEGGHNGVVRRGDILGKATRWTFFYERFRVLLVTDT